jgi:integrase
MSDCLLRISEVVAVDVEDIKGKVLAIGSSKTDPEGRGEHLYICDQTRCVLKRYREMGNISGGTVFQRIRRGDHIHNERLTAHSARRIIKQRAAAGVEGFISGHSLRVGSAVSLAKVELLLWICKLRGAGNPHRCQRITQKWNLLNGAQLHGSKMASDSPDAMGGCAVLY